MRYVLANQINDARELLYARQHTVVVAKAFNLQAIDFAHINFKGNKKVTATDYIE